MITCHIDEAMIQLFSVLTLGVISFHLGKMTVRVLFFHMENLIPVQVSQSETDFALHQPYAARPMSHI